MSERSRQKQRIWLLVALIVLTYFASFYKDDRKHDKPAHVDINQLFKEHKSGVQIQVSGEVIKILPDDNNGTPHQRFIIKLDDGITLLIAHNTDLAPRLNGLKVGDQVSVFGEYEWNDKGGIIHWTHHDPQNQHPHGWIRWHDNLYQ